jgi:hypothetical protein
METAAVRVETPQKPAADGKPVFLIVSDADLAGF